MCFYLLVLSQANDRVLLQIKKVKKNKGISGSGICELGGELADFKTAYNYKISYDRYFAGMSSTIKDRFLYVDNVASDTYDAKLGAITAEDAHMRTSGGVVFPNEEMMKGLWKMSLHHFFIGENTPLRSSHTGNLCCNCS